MKSPPNSGTSRSDRGTKSGPANQFGPATMSSFPSLSTSATAQPSLELTIRQRFENLTVLASSPEAVAADQHTANASVPVNRPETTRRK